MYALDAAILTDSLSVFYNCRYFLQNNIHVHKDSPMKFASNYVVHVVARGGAILILILDTTIHSEIKFK